MTSSVRQPGLLRSIDPADRSCTFLQVDRTQLRHAAFHDHRLGDPARRHLDAGEVSALLSTVGPRRVSYIFHTAFCGSTLLARCLDIPDAGFSLREPEVLMELANHKRMSAQGVDQQARLRETLEIATHLLAVGAKESERVIIKPTNAVNNLIPDVLNLPATDGVLLLYSDLRSFLISVIKKGERCRAYVRQLFNVLILDSPEFSSISERQRLLFTDLQVAAIVWYMQMRNYVSVMQTSPSCNLRTLDSARFFADSRRALAEVAELFGLGLDDERLGALMASGILERDSKDQDIAYDTQVRGEESARVESNHREALETIVEWAQQLQQRMGQTIPARLPLALGDDVE